MATSPTIGSSAVSSLRTATSTSSTTAYKVCVYRPLRRVLHNKSAAFACLTLPSPRFLPPRNEAAVSYPDTPGQWGRAEVEPHRWAHLWGQVLCLPQDRQPAKEGAGGDRVPQDVWELPSQRSLQDQVTSWFVTNQHSFICAHVYKLDRHTVVSKVLGWQQHILIKFFPLVGRQPVLTWQDCDLMEH